MIRLTPFLEKYFIETWEPPEALKYMQQFNRVCYTDKGEIVKTKIIFGRRLTSNLLLELHSNIKIFDNEKETEGWLLKSSATLLIQVFVLENRMEVNTFYLQQLKSWWVNTGNLLPHFFHTEVSKDKNFSTTSVIVPMKEVEIMRAFPVFYINDSYEEDL